MSAALAPFDHQAVQSGASTMLKQAALAVQHVARISDAQTLGEAKIALHAAKELAKLNGVSAQLRVSLTRLEMHIARKAGQLGVKVSGVPASVAAWLRDKSDSEIDSLIERHFGKSAPASIMKAELALREYVTTRARAAQQESIARLKVTDGAETLAALVSAAEDNFYEEDSIRVEQLTDYLGELIGVPTFDEQVEVAGLQGLRLGLWDAVRKSLASGDLDDPRLSGLPRWITCVGREGRGDYQYNLRVPTAKAELRQLQEYVDLLYRKSRETAERASGIADILATLRDAAQRAQSVDGHYGGDLVTVGEAAALLLMPDVAGAA